MFDPRVKMNQSINKGLRKEWELANGKKCSLTPITRLRNQPTNKLVHFDLSLKLNRKRFLDSRARMNQSVNLGSTTDGELTNGNVGFLNTDHHVSEQVIRWTSALRYFKKKRKKVDWCVRINQSRNRGLKIKRELIKGQQFSLTPITRLRNQSTNRLVHFVVKTNALHYFKKETNWEQLSDWRVRKKQSESMRSTTNQ